ncbi:MarR family winged helix-turn-helix transcriptional regulator [Noviherbaspirillum massiliense]|uniref:MarR family winged helix-turn-helix transcriptional regulator n=1 Tax=Noviherbaspirillum massiliense TaxID=1465823 RepID=UPI0003116C03|nr:MarR family transcriptional regulator [Noviherbaspirillum massiliense]
MGKKSNAEEPAHLHTLKKLRIVIRAAQRHSAWIEKQCGVSGAQLWIMRELSETPGLRVGEIAKKLAIHQTTTSNLLDSLEKRGYIIKARDPNDQRVVKLALSEQGEGLLKKAPKPARGLLPEALRKLDEQGLLQLNEGLQALLEVIEQVDEAYGLQPLPFTM